jgi:phosphoribosylformylglycinamidine synthase PurS subunit
LKALIHVTLKTDVLDPQGEAIRKGCASLGYAAITAVRQGKLFEVEFDAASQDEARGLLDELASKLLANPVIESHRIVEIQES